MNTIKDGHIDPQLVFEQFKKYLSSTTLVAPEDLNYILGLDADGTTKLKKEPYNKIELRTTLAAIKRNNDPKNKNGAQNRVIPSITPSTMKGEDGNKYTICELDEKHYGTIAPTMGMIVRCCGFAAGTGGQLCDATFESDGFKIAIIKDQNGHIKGLTAISCDEEKKNLFILGLESQMANPPKVFGELVQSAALSMLENGKSYKNVYITCRGQSFSKMGIMNKQKIGDAISAISPKNGFSRLHTLYNKNGFKTQDVMQKDFVVYDGRERWGKVLSDLPEAQVFTKIASRETRNVPIDYNLRHNPYVDSFVSNTNQKADIYKSNLTKDSPKAKFSQDTNKQTVSLNDVSIQFI